MISTSNAMKAAQDLKRMLSLGVNHVHGFFTPEKSFESHTKV